MPPERESYAQSKPESAERQNKEGRLYSKRVVAILLAGALGTGYLLEPKIQRIVNTVVGSVLEGLSYVKG